MKKTVLAILAVAMLASCWIGIVSAEEEIFSIKINGFDGRIAGGDAYLYKDVETWADNNPVWAYSIHLVPAEGLKDYYIAEKTVNCTGNDGNNDAESILNAGYFPKFNSLRGDLILTVHSNGDSDPNSRAWGINAEQVVRLKGIDAKNNTVADNGALEFYYGMELPSVSDSDDSSSKPDAPSAEWKDMWVTHYNDNTAEGSGVIFTKEYSGANWWYHVAFAPVENSKSAYEIVAISDGTDVGDGVAQEIPDGGFVYCINFGNDYPSINPDGSGVDYATDGAREMLADVMANWKIGDRFVFRDIDFKNFVVPTSTPDVEWYRDGVYVCTAQYKEYEPGVDDKGDSTVPAGDKSKTIIFVVIAVAAFAGVAVLIKTRNKTLGA